MLARKLTATHTPRLRLIAMSENDRRDTPTIEAPPPSSEPNGERITQPPELPGETRAMTTLGTMLPAAGTQEPSYFEEAASKRR